MPSTTIQAQHDGRWDAYAHVLSDAIEATRVREEHSFLNVRRQVHCVAVVKQKSGRVSKGPSYASALDAQS